MVERWAGQEGRRMVKSPVLGQWGANVARNSAIDVLRMVFSQGYSFCREKNHAPIRSTSLQKLGRH